MCQILRNVLFLCIHVGFIWIWKTFIPSREVPVYLKIAIFHYIIVLQITELLIRICLVFYLINFIFLFFYVNYYYIGSCTPLLFTAWTNPVLSSVQTILYFKRLIDLDAVYWHHFLFSFLPLLNISINCWNFAYRLCHITSCVILLLSGADRCRFIH